MMTERPLAVITGASRGLGAALMTEFASRGYNILAISSKERSLTAICAETSVRYGVAAEGFVADLSKGESPLLIFEAVTRRGLAAEVLVNNAGFGMFGPFAENDYQRIDEIIQVNAAAVAKTSRLFLPEMLRRRRGYILNIASLAAFQPGPLMAMYYASKAFVLSFSEAISEECRGTGVSVTCCCPGPIETTFDRHPAMAGARLLGRPWSHEPRYVARAAFKGMARGKRLVVPGGRCALLAMLGRHMPRLIVLRATRWIQHMKQSRGDNSETTTQFSNE